MASPPSVLTASPTHNLGRVERNWSGRKARPVFQLPIVLALMLAPLLDLMQSVAKGGDLSVRGVADLDAQHGQLFADGIRSGVIACGTGGGPSLQQL
jgi:hypothetical protein